MNLKYEKSGNQHIILTDDIKIVQNNQQNCFICGKSILIQKTAQKSLCGFVLNFSSYCTRHITQKASTCFVQVDA
jgi:hypothetical protein